MEAQDPLEETLNRIETLEDLNSYLVTCRRCPRLVAWREHVAQVKRRAFRDWTYWGRPVPGFGDPRARLLVVGLAPAAHGSNRTGRVFTGDASGNFLYPALYRAGFANQPEATHAQDGLRLNDVYIAATCRCAPPDNKPTREEIETCRPYLLAELRMLKNLRGIVALGQIGFDNVLAVFRSLGYEVGRPRFGHNAFHPLGEGLPWLLSSYHPSQQNTQTGRLTEPMFDLVWETARKKISEPV
jgi:uracil-DNA glycosylase